MRLLHVAGAFAAHSLYPQLVRHLRDYCQFQHVFAPVRSLAELSRKPADEPGAIKFDYRRMLRARDRLLFRPKIRRIYAALCDSAALSEFDLLHAHTLYSDGAVAMRASKEHGLRYVVAVRNTDLNFFMRLRPDLRWLRQEILRESSRVVFLSPAYRDALLSRLDGTLRAAVEAKSAVVPNGIGDLWLEQWERPFRMQGAPLRLLYVGDLSPNKNVPGVLRAVSILAARFPVELTLVGAGGSDEQRVLQCLASGQFPFATHLGRIEDPLRLREVYRNHDLFVMPSFRETFGVVYIEALSQGLPVIHSRGQGVDGFFAPGTVGEAVNPDDIQGIGAAIEALAGRLDTVIPLCFEAAKDFSWHAVARRYDEIYRSIVR